MRHDLIERFETAQSISYREYSSWKETKWGEDQLDEVEIDDEDVYLELSLPWVFANPLIQCPPVRELMESVYSHLAAHVISLISMITNLGYYYRHPLTIPNAVLDIFKLLLPSSNTFLVHAASTVERVLGQDEDEEEEDDDEEYPSKHGEEEDGQTLAQYLQNFWWKSVTFTAFLVAGLIAGSLSICVLLIASLISCFIPATWINKPQKPLLPAAPDRESISQQVIRRTESFAHKWLAPVFQKQQNIGTPGWMTPASSNEFYTPAWTEEEDLTVASIRDRWRSKAKFMSHSPTR